MRLFDLADKPLAAVVEIDRDPKIDQPRARVVRRRTTTRHLSRARREGHSRRRPSAGTSAPVTAEVSRDADERLVGSTAFSSAPARSGRRRYHRHVVAGSRPAAAAARHPRPSWRSCLGSAGVGLKAFPRCPDSSSNLGEQPLRQLPVRVSHHRVGLEHSGRSAEPRRRRHAHGTGDADRQHAHLARGHPVCSFPRDPPAPLASSDQHAQDSQPGISSSTRS